MNNICWYIQNTVVLSFAYCYRLKIGAMYGHLALKYWMLIDSNYLRSEINQSILGKRLQPSSGLQLRHKSPNTWKFIIRRFHWLYRIISICIWIVITKTKNIRKNSKASAGIVEPKLENRRHISKNFLNEISNTPIERYLLKLHFCHRTFF